MQAGAARSMTRALAAATVLAGSLGASPGMPSVGTAPSSAVEVLARYTGQDARVSSYAVPIHMDVRVKKVITFHMGFDGTQYFKRPDRIALDVARIPPQGKKLFAEIGTPLTWPAYYDLKLVAANGDRGPYRLEGVPKKPSDIAKMVVDIDGDPNAPLHGVWTTKDGTVVDMRITESLEGGYEFPKHAEADLAVSGYKIHASIDYGSYTVNEALADAVFNS